MCSHDGFASDVDSYLRAQRKKVEDREQEEARYLYNQDTDLWYDTITGEYSRYDDALQLYVPVPTADQETATDQEPETDREPDTDQEPTTDQLCLVVLESELLPTGQVVVVDTNGLTVGRDRSWDRRLRLAELPVSKYHCQIYYDDDGYHVIDLGSRNGTFLNKQRLSDPKSSSVPNQLHDLDQLQIGSTLFEVHRHDDGWQCENCHLSDGNTVDTSNSIRKPKPVPQQQEQRVSMNDLKTSKEREKEWMDELRRLKRSYAPAEETDPDYVDAADRRRRLHASITTPSYCKPPVSSSTPALQAVQQEPRIQPTERATIQTPVQGVGNTMLRKMGWQDGQSLGRTGTNGILAPISPRTQTHRAGLGSSQASSSLSSGQQHRHRITKQRYNQS